MTTMILVVEACSGNSCSSSNTTSITSESQGSGNATRIVGISIEQSEDATRIYSSNALSQLEPRHLELKKPTREHFSGDDDSHSKNQFDNNEAECSSTTSSYHSLKCEDCDLEDDLNGSECSFPLDDLLGRQCAQDTIHGESSCESSLKSENESGCHDIENDIDSCNDASHNASQSDRSLLSGRTCSRKLSDRGQGWENLSSRTLYGEEESLFDMSSRSVLEDFDFEVDCADIIEQRAHLPPRGAVRFSAGKKPSDGIGSFGVRTARTGTVLSVSPMTRITEHTRESSAWGSQSDLSGRCSFESVSPSIRFGSIRTRAKDVVIASPSPNASYSSLGVQGRVMGFDDLIERLSGSKLA